MHRIMFEIGFWHAVLPKNQRHGFRMALNPRINNDRFSKYY